MSLFHFPFGSIRRLAIGRTGRSVRRASSAGKTDGFHLVVERFESRAMLAAQIIEVTSTLPANTAVGIGNTIPVQVIFNEPVVVIGNPVANVNVIKPGGTQAVATYTGASGGGLIQNFSYTVAEGDSVPQFDVALTAPFLVGGIITTASTGVANDADRNVVAGDPTIVDMQPGLSVDGVAPAVPTVDPTVYVNPAVWTDGLWATLHADYFVIRGTAGTGPLAAGEVLRVTVNGATYQPAVGGDGGWNIYLRTVGANTATKPISGVLAPWSTTDTDTYDVVATLTDAAGNTSTDANDDEIYIDTVAPAVAAVNSTSTSGPDTLAGSYKAGDIIDLYVVYDQPIRVIGTPLLPINVLPGPAFATFVDVVNGNEAHFRYTVQPGDSTPAAGFNVSGTAITLNGGFIEDLAANAAPLVPPTTAPVNTVTGIVIDTTAPTVASVSASNVPGTYVVGSPTITVTVTFDKAVFVTGGVPQLSLNSAPGRVATYAGGTGTSTLSFSYVVQSDDDTPRLDYTTISALTLNGAAIRDAADNDAVLTLPVPGTAGSLGVSPAPAIVVAARPAVIQVSSPDPAGTYTAGDTVRIRVTFDKKVEVTGGLSPTLSLATSPTAVATWSNALPGGYIDAAGNATTTPTDQLQFTYLVKPGDTTSGAVLNYGSTVSLQPGAGINLSPAPITPPGVLAGNLALPPLLDPDNVLPAAGIVIAPDTIAPAMPTITLAVDSANDIGNSPTDGITNGGTTKVTTVNVVGLESKPNTTWQYSTDNGANWSTPAATGTAGTATFTLPANSNFAAGAVQVRQTDWSGNTSAVASNPIAWTTDTAAPLPLTSATVVETGVPGSGFTNSGAVTVTGLAANALLEWNKTFNGTVVTNDIVGPGGWQTAPSGSFTLGTGIYDPAGGTGVVVRQQDLAGNYSPFIQLSTTGGVNGITVVIDTAVTAPTMGFSPNDTTPGFVPFNGAPYNADSYTSNGQINIGGLEVQNIAGGVAGIAKWEYRVNAGSWTLGGTTAPSGTFTLTAGSYTAGSVEVRETDLAGNQVTVNNPITWTVDQSAPTVASVTAPVGPHGANVTVPITVTFNESVFLTGAPTLTLGNNGRTATLAATPPLGPTTTLVFNYVVQPSDSAAALVVSGFNLNGATIADLAGNVANLGTGFFPATLPGPVVIKTDTVAAMPLVALASDTTPGIGFFTGAPYTTDGYTSDGIVNVDGLELVNIPNSQTGLANWEYSTDGGLTWITTTFATPPTTLPTPNATFTLAPGVYAVNAIQVRQTDVAGNTSTAWTNAVPWTVDQTAPAIQSITTTAGTYGIGSTVTISVNFGELVYLSAAPTLTLDTGATATLSAATPITVGNSTLQFTYVVRPGDVSSGLKVTAFNVADGTMADKAGNVPVLPIVTAPIAVIPPAPPGSVVIDALIKASAPRLAGSPIATGPTVATPLTTLQIVFNTPVRNFTLASLKLYWNPSTTGTPTRVMALTGASIRMVGTSGTTYTLTLPRAATSAKGAYMLVVGGPTSVVTSTLNPSGRMTTPSRIYFRRV